MALQQVRAEVAALERRLATLRVAPVPGARAARNRRRRQRRRAERAEMRAVAVVAPMAQNPGVNRAQPLSTGRRRRRRGAALNPEGNVRVARTELLFEVVGASQRKSATLEMSSFTWLSKIAKAFDRVTWHSAALFWKPAVGTTTDGLIAYGVDWNSSASSWDRTNVLALTPVADHPVWQCTDCNPLVLPSQKLMSRKEYLVTAGGAPDRSPGVILLSCSGTENKTYGELWIHYDVSLFGTA